jgi:hypothetical protein
MGYRTVNHVPSIYTYGQARQIFDKVEPIRGRDIKPLGQRRDADTYHIRMNGEDVECVLYKTPVVTFHPDETITIYTGNWNTASTHQFIWAITGCATRGSRGKTVIHIVDKDYVIEERMKMRYINEGATKWEVLTKEEQYDWRLDRQKANAVRAKYKEFIKYITGAMKLRTIQKDDYEAVEFNSTELVEEFGFTDIDGKGGLINNEHYRHIDTKAIPEHMGKFIELIGAQGEDTTAAYYRAMLMLAGRCYHRNYFTTGATGKPLVLSARAMLDKAYECMYKWHSKDVFVRIKLAEGKVPTRRYDTWL